ncbi:hypothetical protein ACVTW2_000680 [Escherichia coli]
MKTHNVTMPSGIVINDVPVDYSKEQLVNKLLANGYTLNQLGLDNSPSTTAPVEDKESMSYALHHPEEAFGELGKDVLLGVVGTRDKADWEHPLNYLSPWANKEDAGDESVHNAKVAQRVGNAALNMAAFASGAEVLEAVPEVAALSEGGKLAKTAKVLLTNAAGATGSAVEEAVNTGKFSPKDFAKDIVFGSALEGAGEYLIKPATRQAYNLFQKLNVASLTDYAASDAVKEYLAASRTYDMAKDYAKIKAKNPNATILDAYQRLYEQSPDIYNTGSIEDIKEFVKPLKNNIDPEEFLDYALSNKTNARDFLKELSNRNARSGKLIRTAENNANYKGSWLTGRMKLDNDLVEATPLQRMGELAGDYAGFNNELSAAFKGKEAINAVKQDADRLIAQLKNDNKRLTINQEKLNASGKTGAHITSHKTALRLQKQMNNRMIDFLESGLTGKRIPMNEFALTIKEAEEQEFGNENFIKSFRDLAERFDQLKLTKIEGDTTELGDAVKGVAKFAFKKSGLGGALYATPMMAGGVSVAASIAGRLAQRSKSKVLEGAYQLLQAVKEGKITSNEAEQMLQEAMNNSNKQVKAVRSAVATQDQN